MQPSKGTTRAILDRLSLDRIDWFKTDSQGIDLRLFNSLRDEVRSRVLAVDIEPGLISAYLGEDTFVDVHKNLTRSGFWLSNVNVCGTVRMRKSALDEAQKKDFLRDRKGCVVGRKLARQFGWKIGDQVPLRGTIYPGAWSFTVRAIYEGLDRKTDESQFFFHWDYLNETAKKTGSRTADNVGIYIATIDRPAEAAAIAKSIDALFKNSLAETLTETEKAFQLGFVAMTEAILIAIRAVSYVVIVIILAVMANTMAMTARERLAEYATLKALGFPPGFAVALIFGESLAIALIGGLIGVAASFPIADAFGKSMGTLFPVFFISKATVVMQLAAAVLIGAVAAVRVLDVPLDGVPEGYAAMDERRAVKVLLRP